MILISFTMERLKLARSDDDRPVFLRDRLCAVAA
jgi:hypothetical protein